MKKYEYIVMRSNYAGDLEHLTEQLNEVGDKGWELCGITGNVGFPLCVFKKEKE